MMRSLCLCLLAGCLAATNAQIPVRLSLALEYLTNDVAQALLDPLSTVNSHFCLAVNEQASGNQVAFAAQNVSITTRVQGTIDQPDYECLVLWVQQVPDHDAQDLLGPGYVRVEVLVQQVVYVEPPLLSVDELTALVTLGFARGLGGRVKFRSLLQQNPAFGSVLDVKVLDPIPVPTMVPSSLPSSRPTSAPSSRPTTSLASSAPSSLPSSGPSSLPSMTPTVIPSTSPTALQQSPTSHPTTFLRPTSAPTVRATAVQKDKDQRKRYALVLGAIAGGVATILVSCFFLFCVWYPLCRRRRDEDQTLVPGIVSLSDENKSLAETTLGEETAKLSPRKTPQEGQLKPQDSFDEGSLYTTSTKPVESQTVTSLKISKLDIQPIRLPSTLTSNLEFEEDIVFLQSDEVSSEASTPVSAMLEVESMGMSSIHFGGDGSDNSSFSAIQPTESNEDMAREVSETMTSGTKGYDPFEESVESSVESSFGFTSTDTDSREHTKGLVDDFTNPSAASSVTKKVGNLSPSQRLTGPVDTVEEDSNVMEAGPMNRKRPSDSNNSLLRSVLEDARLLSEANQSSNRSRYSRVTAPPRVLESSSSSSSDKHEHSRDAQSLSSSPQRDKKRWSVANLPVGNPYRTRFIRPPTKDLVAPESVPTNDNPPSGYSMEARSVPRKRRPSTSPSSSPTGMLGAHPRSSIAASSAETSTVSSPGVLGIANQGRSFQTETSSSSDGYSEDPWIYDAVEHALSPCVPMLTTPSTDLESPGIEESNYTTPPAGNKRRTPLDAIDSESDGAASFGESDISPRSLENDLRNLERQLASVLHGDPNQPLDSSTKMMMGTPSAPPTTPTGTRQIVVSVPPGKLGVVLSNRNDGKGTVVSDIRAESTMAGVLTAGDRLGTYSRHRSTMCLSLLTGLQWRSMARMYRK